MNYLKDATVEWKNYFDDIKDYFSVLENKSVIEVGPWFGYHTEIFQEFKPLSLTLVEPDIDNYLGLVNKFNGQDISIINDDIFTYLPENKKKVDVVTLLGVLYHFHSPLHLLELVVNYLNPEILFLDYPETRYNDEEGVLVRNEPNERSYYRGRKDFKIIHKSILFNYVSIIDGMSDLGYKVTLNLKPKNSYDYCKTMMLFYKFEKI